MAGTRGYIVKLFIFTLVFFRLVLFGGKEKSINILEKSRYIIKLIPYILRLTHKKRKENGCQICTKYITNKLGKPRTV